MTTQPLEFLYMNQALLFVCRWILGFQGNARENLVKTRRRRRCWRLFEGNAKGNLAKTAGGAEFREAGAKGGGLLAQEYHFEVSEEPEWSKPYKK